MGQIQHDQLQHSAKSIKTINSSLSSQFLDADLSVKLMKPWKKCVLFQVVPPSQQPQSLDHHHDQFVNMGYNVKKTIFLSRKQNNVSLP